MGEDSGMCEGQYLLTEKMKSRAREFRKALVDALRRDDLADYLIFESYETATSDVVPLCSERVDESVLNMLRARQQELNKESHLCAGEGEHRLAAWVAALMCVKSERM